MWDSYPYDIFWFDDSFFSVWNLDRVSRNKLFRIWYRKCPIRWQQIQTNNIVETIFNYPGIAKLMVDAVATRDLPLVQSCAMIFCFGYLMLIMLADIISILSNPRLRT